MASEAKELAREAELESSGDTVTLGGLAESIGFLLRICQVHTFESFYNRFGETELRPGEFSILWIIHLNPGIRQGLVAQTLRIKPAQMTKMVRRLEDQGRIARHVPDDDRRSVHLHLTAAGQDFVHASESAFLGADSYHNHGLSPEETAQLAQLLRRYAGFQMEDGA